MTGTDTEPGEIRQPNLQIEHMFDSLVLMSTGRTTPNILDDVTALDRGADSPADALRRIERVRSWLDAKEASAAARSERDAQQGRGAGSRQDLLAAGTRTSKEANRIADRAETLAVSPTLGNALHAGEIGAAHVDAITSAGRDLDDHQKAELLDDPEVTDAAKRMRPDSFATFLRRKVRAMTAAQAEDKLARQRNATRLRMWVGRDGMHHLSADFDPETGNRVFTAVDAEFDALVAAGEPRNDRTRARAAAAVLQRGHAAGPATTPAEIIVIDAGTLATGEIHEHTVCETGSGADLPPSAVDRVMCESIVLPTVITSGGDRLQVDVGRHARVANRAQRRALRAMYPSCAFGDCHQTFDRCEIHHLQPWLAGGPTDLANLLPLCSRHHHLVHDRHWRLRLDPDRTLHIAQPDGTHHQTVPIPIDDLLDALAVWPKREPRPLPADSAEDRPAHNRAA